MATDNSSSGIDLPASAAPPVAGDQPLDGQDKSAKKPPPLPPALPGKKKAAEGAATSTATRAPHKQPQRPTSFKKSDANEEAAAEDLEEPEEYGPTLSQRIFSGDMTACLFSVVAHMVILLVLALWMLPGIPKYVLPTLTATATDAEEDTQLQDLDTPVEQLAESSSAQPSSDSASGGAVTMSTTSPTNPQELAATEGISVHLEGPPIKVPGTSKLISKVPEGAVGEPRAIVDNYDQAMDRITQEILLMLNDSKVLVVWCFDQSGSMKDDQIEIRDRIDRVYQELGLHASARGDSLLTVVTSYGQGYAVHTRKPTSDVEEIRDAIDLVPVDPSGKEMMCQAVGTAITQNLSSVKAGRKMALILVSDESGERENNSQYLEPMIAQAKAARCTAYILGREAVFGYPYAHISWRHPQTGHIHWIPIDRGPETAFVEQLQTECFRKRTDAHPSGFGPFEQVRLARETGGIFFMLPSLESKLVRGEKRKYELEAMRGYLPDLRAGAIQAQERDNSILRGTITKIIYDLNPYRKEIAAAMAVSFDFSAKPEAFVKQVRKEQEKAKQYILYLDAAAKTLEQLKPHRKTEYNPRWQANYDIIYAQVLAYTARTYEYGAYLEHFIKNPKRVPLDIPKKKHRLSSWHLGESQSIRGGEITESYIERATKKFQHVIETHPGTPWSARAEWELRRGFGVELHPRYHYYGPRPPRKPGRPAPKRIPVPKL